ncbi:MAG: DUF3379 family protein [Pseudomonadota bacterium]|nr:MAG: DUF3379 family protein [Pseudomonadota bacterium]
MNCLEFRRRITAEPVCSDAEVELHRRMCRSCAAFARRQQGFERQLRSVIKRINTPDTLGARILLRQGTAATHLHRARRTRLFAAAATVLLSVGLVFGVAMAPATPSLAQTVVAHVNGELHHLTDRNAVKLAQLNDVFARYGTALTQGIGTVHYAGACTIRKYSGVHMVLQGEKGVVTVLFMPREHRLMRTPIMDRRFDGVIVPTPVGSMAIVGERGEPLGEIEQRIGQALNYSAGKGETRI